MGDIREWARGVSPAEAMEAPERVPGGRRELLAASRWSVSEQGRRVFEFENDDGGRAAGCAGRWCLKYDGVEEGESEEGIAAALFSSSPEEIWEDGWKGVNG